MTVRRHPKSPFWYYDFWFKKRRYKGTTKETSKVKAQEHEDRLKYQLRTGSDPFVRSPLLKGLLPRYESWLEGNNMTSQHRDRSRRAIQNVCDRLKGAKAVEDITPSKIQEFKSRRLKEVSPNTVNLELRHFRAFLRRCVKQGWLNSIPVDIEMVRTPSRGRLVFLTRDEINPFLDNLPPWARAAARLNLLTGLRLDEMRFLEWQDVDLDGGELWVKNKPELSFAPKNGKERSVPLPPELIEELRVRKRKSGWVLRAAKGGQIDRRTFQAAVVRAGKAAGLPKTVTPHVLRHTYGSQLAMIGVPLPTIQSLMGHSTIQTTMIYVHLSEQHRRQAVAKLSLPEHKEREEKVIALET